jgi:Tol biopolymer transport system component
VTHHHDVPADFSPDGSRIFFFRAVEGFPSIGDQQEGSLFVVNADGMDLHRVTPKDMPVEVDGNSGGRLSVDGRWIVFTSSGDIWKIHPDGSGLTKVFKDSKGRLAITPTWSPDGSFILFGLDPAGSLAVVDPAPVNGLYVIRADGTGLTPVLVSNDWKREPDWVAGSATTG